MGKSRTGTTCRKIGGIDEQRVEVSDAGVSTLPTGQPNPAKGKPDRFEGFTTTFSRWVNWLAGAGILLMLGLSVADIIGIKVFKNPIPGAIEIVGFLGVIVTAFAIAYTQVVHGHIQVEFFVKRLPQRWQGGVGALVSLLGAAMFGLLAWRSIDFGHALQVTGEVSMTQRIPFYPFVYALAFACIPVCLVLLAGFLKSLTRMMGK